MPTLARHATRQRAASDIAMQVTVRVLNLALGVFVTALLVRSLGTTEYGEWGTTLLVLGLVAYFTNFGFEGVALREAAKDPEAEHEWIGAVILMRLLLLVPVMSACAIALLLLPAHRRHADRGRDPDRRDAVRRDGGAGPAVPAARRQPRADDRDDAAQHPLGRGRRADPQKRRRDRRRSPPGS